MLYMTVWAIKHRTSVNNFAYETAEVNIEVKHLLFRIILIITKKNAEIYTLRALSDMNDIDGQGGSTNQKSPARN